MSYPALVSLLIGSMMVLILIPVFRLLKQDSLFGGGARDEPKASLLVGLVVVALIGFVLCALKLRTWNPTSGEAACSAALAAAMFAGVAVKWLVTVLGYKRLRSWERELMFSLLAAPGSLVIWKGIVGTKTDFSDSFLWFLAGYFWCTLFCDVTQILFPEKEVLRRREGGEYHSLEPTRDREEHGRDR